jgi:1,4-alpha-glucan branching enzyme
VSLKKQYPKGGSECKVTFFLSTDTAGSAGTAHVVGDFNNWDRSANPMKRSKDGSFTVTIALQKNKEYQFRYLLDGERWENDRNADKYVTNEHGSENSVAVV